MARLTSVGDKPPPYHLVLNPIYRFECGVSCFDRGCQFLKCLHIHALKVEAGFALPPRRQFSGTLWTVPAQGTRRWDEEALVYDAYGSTVLQHYAFYNRWYAINCNLDKELLNIIHSGALLDFLYATCPFHSM